MKRKFILLPIALTALTPLISCSNGLISLEVQTTYGSYHGLSTENKIHILPDTTHTFYIDCSKLDCDAPVDNTIWGFQLVDDLITPQFIGIVNFDSIIVEKNGTELIKISEDQELKKGEVGYDNTNNSIQGALNDWDRNSKFTITLRLENGDQLFYPIFYIVEKYSNR